MCAWFIFLLYLIIGLLKVTNERIVLCKWNFVHNICININWGYGLSKNIYVDINIYYDLELYYFTYTPIDDFNVFNLVILTKCGTTE